MSNVRLDQTYVSPNNNSYTFLDSVKLRNDDASTPITLSAEAAAFGGIQDPNGGPAAHKTLSVVGLPYGPYGLGCVECIFSTKDSYGGAGAQAALSGIDYRNGSWAINNGDMATAMTYRGFVNEHSRFSVNVSYFDQQNAYLATPMTTEQMAQIHQGMYITTNNIDPTCTPALDTTGVYNDCRLRGIVWSYTPSSIKVYGWGRVGGGNAVGNPTPHPTQAEKTAGTDITSYLDTVYEKMPIPLLYVGAGGKDFAGNDYLIVDANRAYSTEIDTTTTAVAKTGATSITVASFTGLSNGWYVTGPGIPKMTTITSINGNTSVVSLSQALTADLPSGSALKFYSPITNGTNSYEMIERNTRIRNATPEHPISFHGTTESFECDGCEANGINDDSYMYLVNGPGLARAFVAQMPSDSLEFSGYNSWIPGNGAPGTTGDNRVAFAFRKELPTNNSYALVARTVKDLDISNTWAAWDMRLGLIIDPTLEKAVVSGGVSMGDIAWNPYGMSGNICFMANETVTFCSNNNKLNAFIPMEFAKDVKIDGSLQTSSWFLSSASLRAGSSGSTTSSDATVGGQGTFATWNTVTDGGANTEFININPSGAFAGGFAFFVGDNGNTLASLLKVLQLNEWTVDSYRPVVVHGYGVTSDYMRTSTTTKTLTTIQSETHAEGDKIYCHDCRAPGEATGAGTGRWIYLNSKSVWKTDDGLDASN